MTYLPDPLERWEDELPVLRFPDEIRALHPPPPTQRIKHSIETAVLSSEPSLSSRFFSSSSHPNPPDLPPSTPPTPSDLRKIIPSDELPPPHAARATLRTSRKSLPPEGRDVVALDADRPPARPETDLAPERSKRSWGRIFLSLSLLGLGILGLLVVGLLEAGYQRSLQDTQTTSQRFTAEAKAIQEALASFQTPDVIRSSRQRLALFDLLSKKLASFQDQICHSKTGDRRLSLPRFVAPWLEKGHAIYKSFPASWLRGYAALRSSGRPAPTSSPLPVASNAPPSSPRPTAAVGHRSCLATVEDLRSAFHQRVLQWAEDTWKTAQRRLETYAFCQGLWSKAFSSPIQGPVLRRLQAECSSSCEDPRSAGCLACFQQVSSDVPLPPPQISELLRIMALDRQAECLQNGGGDPLSAGVFHWGLSVWSSLQILRAFAHLEASGPLPPAFQRLRETLGFRLRLRSLPASAPIYLLLWSQSLRPKHPLLRRLLQEPVGWADGRDLWLPAIPSTIAGRKAPAGAWFLLHLYDSPSRKRGILPLSPKPGQKIEGSLTLEDIQIHHDARLPIEALTISPDHHLLTYAALRQRPHEAPKPFAPSCSPPAVIRDLSSPAWMHVISVFSLDPQGLPRPPGDHLPLASALCGLTFVDSTHLLSCEGEAGSAATSTAEAPKPQAFLRRRPFLRSETRLLFGPPHTLLTTDASKPPRPLNFQSDEPTVFQHTCPWENETLRLLSSNAQRSPVDIPLTSEGLLFDAAKSPHTFAALFHTETEPPQAFLRFLPWKDSPFPASSTFLPPKAPLPHPFQQIRFSGGRWFLAGGPWGRPLMRWTSQKTSEIWAGHPDIRYLSPAFHAPSQRLYSILQWRFVHTTGREDALTFLVSRQTPSPSP